jgi:hypothetical protein
MHTTQFVLLKEAKTEFKVEVKFIQSVTRPILVINIIISATCFGLLKPLSKTQCWYIQRMCTLWDPILFTNYIICILYIILYAYYILYYIYQYIIYINIICKHIQRMCTLWDTVLFTNYIICILYIILYAYVYYIILYYIIYFIYINISGPRWHSG